MYYESREEAEYAAKAERELSQSNPYENPSEEGSLEEFVEFSSGFVGPPEKWEWELCELYEGAE